MAYNQRRPTGGYGGSMYDSSTKASFEEVVASYGQTYTVERVNKGQWNEGRWFAVGGKQVGYCPKGARPNWDAMEREVARAFACAQEA
jgi:hypothetical protein